MVKPRPAPDTLPRIAAELCLKISINVCVLSMVKYFNDELERSVIELGQSVRSFLVDCGNDRLGAAVSLETDQIKRFCTRYLFHNLTT